MNRTILVARLLAVIIVVVFAMLMMNLYARLKRLEAEQPRTPVSQPAR